MPEIVFQKTSASSDQSEIENFQITLASLNQRVLTLQESLQEKDQEIADLKKRLTEEKKITEATEAVSEKVKVDDSLTIIGALIKLYKLIFPPGKALS